MKIQFVGTGGAFDYKYRNSAALIELNGRRVLIDAGNNIYFTLREKNAIEQVDEILITHFHDDHVGSLSSIILHHKHFKDRNRPIKLYYPTESFRQMLHDYLKFSLHSPENYFEFKAISDTKDIEAIDTTGMHIENMPSYGFIFKENEEVIAYSGDLGNADVIFNHLKRNNISEATVFHDIFFNPNVPTHAYYKDIEKHLNEYKIWGYHCDPTQAPNDLKIPLVYNHSELML